MSIGVVINNMYKKNNKSVTLFKVDTVQGFCCFFDSIEKY